MTATDELRRLLDERGVEWMSFGRHTYWPDDSSLTCDATEEGDGQLCLTFYPTPEQAVDATLGRGTCREVENEFGYTICSECGAVLPEDYTVYYCWNCGRKVRA